MTRFFRYVPHDHQPDYEREGWQFAADLGPTHGEYRVLMQWKCRCDSNVCDCKCVEPVNVPA